MQSGKPHGKAGRQREKPLPTMVCIYGEKMDGPCMSAG